MLHRFSRTALLVGEEGLLALNESKVAVFGLGGVGGAAAEALVRSGVGHIVLVDHDEVSLTNINRQLVALDSTLGKPKVEVLKERFFFINPECRVEVFKEFYDLENASSLLCSDYRYVVDAIDSMSAKIDLMTRCFAQRIPLVSAMGAGNKLDPTKLEIADISLTHTCPMARVVRASLRKLGITKGIEVVFSTESPVSTQGMSICKDRSCSQSCSQEKCKVVGSSAFVPPAMGMALASVVVRNLLQG